MHICWWNVNYMQPNKIWIMTYTHLGQVVPRWVTKVFLSLVALLWLLIVRIRLLMVVLATFGIYQKRTLCLSSTITLFILTLLSGLCFLQYTSWSFSLSAIDLIIVLISNLSCAKIGELDEFPGFVWIQFWAWSEIKIDFGWI